MPSSEFLTCCVNPIWVTPNAQGEPDRFRFQPHLDLGKEHHLERRKTSSMGRLMEPSPDWQSASWTASLATRWLTSSVRLSGLKGTWEIKLTPGYDCEGISRQLSGWGGRPALKVCCTPWAGDGWIKRYGEGRAAAETCLLLVYCDVCLIQA